PALDPGRPWELQGRRLDQVVRGWPIPRGTIVTRRVLNGVRAEVVTAGGVRPERTVLHLHGGGYCIGSPRMMRTRAAHPRAQAARPGRGAGYPLAPAPPPPPGPDDPGAGPGAPPREGP